MKDKIAQLRKQRASINAALKLLLKNRKGNPERRAEGPIYYAYSDYSSNQPRVTVAGHVNHDKKELYYGVKVIDSRDQFIKSEGRNRAMGQAVSRAHRQSIRLKNLNHKAVREVMSQIAKKEFLNAINRQKYVRRNGQAVAV